ncbi:MAG: L-2-amino-thiazoline-4-carboxylic acid hydrolase [Sporomusaceae bacterium]|nr:L-2-amino-thiazoline-4-carboxylic acid hydrolase [Sporomusaceae bacterium]
MSQEQQLDARSHAYLFGAIAKNVIDTFGEAGIEAVGNGVVHYGRQRGKRMALRAQADGVELTALNYIAYGEWSAREGEMDFSVPTKDPDIQFFIKKCPWHDLWQEEGWLEAYGYLYCKYVDVAIAAGYNPELVFDIVECRGLGDPVCDMRLLQANVSSMEEEKFAERVRLLGNKVKMPWNYHCGHLFKALWEVVIARFGYSGFQAMQESLDLFAKRYGAEAVEQILEFMNQDFNDLPQ